MELAARNYKVVYATAMENLNSIEDIDDRDIDPEEHDYLEAEQAFRYRLNELYDAAQSGDEDAKMELVNTAIASEGGSLDSKLLITRQYVNPDQGSLF